MKIARNSIYLVPKILIPLLKYLLRCLNFLKYSLFKVLTYIIFYFFQPSVAKIEAPDDALPVDPGVEVPAKNDSVNFLENTRATDACQDTVDMKIPAVRDEEVHNSSSTVGSLKFFLGNYNFLFTQFCVFHLM